MTSFNKKQGFSLLEMVIAIFIIAVVLGFSLIAMGKGMGLSAKSNDVAIATAIAEQEMARVKNIPFPPTSVDGQGDYTIANPSYNNNFRVDVIEEIPGSPSSIGYNNLFGVVIPIPPAPANPDEVMLKRIEINVYRVRDNARLVTFVTYIARNGTI